MNSHLLAAEIVRRLTALAADNAQNAATVIESLIAEADSKDIFMSSVPPQKNLRDEFAMSALPAIVSSMSTTDCELNPPASAARAYAIADAMIAARK